MGEGAPAGAGEGMRPTQGELTYHSNTSNVACEPQQRRFAGRWGRRINMINSINSFPLAPYEVPQGGCARGRGSGV
jgi:hypothetical protein